MKLRTLKLLLALLSLISIAVDWKVTTRLGETEFSGGSISGPLFRMSEAAFPLFVIALLLIVRLPRAGAAVIAVASLLCTPLSLLLLAPGPFRRIAGGQWSVPSNLVLSWWTLGWEFSIAACLAISLAILLRGQYARQ